MAATNNLGFPIITHGRVGNVYNFVVNKIENKLVGWKSKLLSKAGKLVLAKTKFYSLVYGDKIQIFFLMNFY